MAKPEPPKEALEYFRAKGYKLGWDWRDVWKEEHVRAFTVAKAMQMDLLKDIRLAVDDALANGTTFRDFQKQLNPLLAKRGWVGTQEIDGQLVELGTPRRLKIIYDTNLRVARNAGQWERIQRNKKVMPFLVYSLGPSRDHRPDHEKLTGTILPVNDSFWNTHMPPNGYGCRCRVRQITKAQADKLGGQSKPPELKLVEWENKRTGRIEKVPEGTDPGWNYNPGKHRLANTETFAKEKEKEFEQVVGKPSKQDQPAKPAESKPRIVPSAFSTVKGVDADGMEQVIRSISGNARQIERLEAFIQDKQTKTLFIKQAEMGAKNKAAKAIRDDIISYIGDEFKWFGIDNYTISKPAKCGGFTSFLFNHIVIKAGVSDNLKKALADPDITKKLVSQAIKDYNAINAPAAWTISHAEAAGALKEHRLIATWLHELGHQIHYFAGAPKVPAGAKYLTQYSHHSEHEYHAEHFVAWFLNRDEYEKFDPIGAKHFDELIEKAIKGKEKKR